MHTYIIIFLLENNKVVYPCCVLQATLQPQNKAFSLKKRLRAAPWRLPGPGLSFSASKVTPVCPKQGAIPYRAWLTILDKHENDLGGCRDQAYDFQHQKLPLYAQSREPFHTGHGRPFWTNTQANKQTNKFLFALLI